MALKFLAFLFGVALLPSCHYLVTAEDEADGAAADATPAEAAAEVATEGEPSEAEELDPAATGEKFMDSAKELQDKLGQLKELLANRGEEVDPDLKARLDGLQKQLGGLGSSLGLDKLGLGGEEVPGSKELTEFLGGCVAMAMRRAGMKKPATMGAMRRLATDGFTKEQGKAIELVKLIAVCINDMSDTELELYKAGKMTQASKAMEDKSRTAEGRDSVLAIEDAVWQELVKVATGVVKGFGGEDPRKNDVSSTVGLLALVPIIGAAVFLGKKFLDMQKENDAKSAAKKAKKGK